MRWIVAAALPLVIARGVAAQVPLDWPARLSGATRDSLERVADSARAARLPVELLVAKSAEGVLKGADDARILRAVRGLARELGDARAALPVGATTATLAAGASALHAGVSAQTLRRLAAAGADPADLAVGLVTVADLVAVRVPAEAAAASVEELLRRRAPEAELSAFRAGVAQDIAAGRSPESALTVRTQALVRILEAQPLKPPGAARPR
jgi:hypothetical protein